MDRLLEKELAAVADNLALIGKTLDSDRNKLEKACEAAAGAISRGGKILVAGNGGSAADAQHFAAELSGRYMRERKGLPAVALTTDTSVLTAIGNDYGFEAVFSRQVEALGRPGDLFIGISTSGNSSNIVAALRKASETGLTTLSLTGGGGGAASGIADLSIDFPSRETPRIQEYHAIVLHLIAAYIDSKDLVKR